MQSHDGNKLFSISSDFMLDLQIIAYIMALSKPNKAIWKGNIMAHVISNNDNVIDSRDVIERIEEL